MEFTKKLDVINTISRFSNMEDSLKYFFEVLDAYDNKINKSKQKMIDIYSFNKPESPYFEYELNDGFSYIASSWANTKHKRKLDNIMQITVQRLVMTPWFDYVPSIVLGGWDSGMIARMMGSTVEPFDIGTVVKKYAV